MKTMESKKYNENKEIYKKMVNRYGAPFTEDILSRYTDIDVKALQYEEKNDA